MAIVDITYPKGMYFFKGYLAEMVLESSVIALRDLFLALVTTKICTSKNIAIPPKIYYPPTLFRLQDQNI